ncbi:MAG: DUF1801 domain-containing protein [Caldilineaceae bacterium]|nr:DUF1801 domain-containing protein [Caldilineaceae bacterium]
MQSEAKTVEEYLSELDEGRREAIAAVRAVILENLPAGYEETMQHGMIAYIVPSSVVAETYNGQPLVYIALASQKRHMSLYLTGVYGDEATAEWFRERYLATGKRMDMGKSCVRFTKLENLPLDLVGEVVAMTPMADFIGHAGVHEGSRTRRRKARAKAG